MLRDRVIACIAANPSIDARTLRHRFFRDTDPRAFGLCLRYLRRTGAVMLSGVHYRLPEPEGATPKPLATTPRRDAGSDFIQPPSRERLMARR